MNNSIFAAITTTGKNKLWLSLLASLKEQTILPAGCCLIFEADTAGAEKFLRDCPFPAEFLRRKKGIYLTRMLNEAIFRSNEPYVLVLNDDVTLEKNFTAALVAVLARDERAGIACPKILRPDGRTLDSAGQFLGRDRRAVERGYARADEGRYEKEELVFGGCAAAVMYRRRMLEDIAAGPGEYFDNDYHMFYEDLDISWRAKNSGWKAVYTPHAVARHVRGATAKTGKPPVKFFAGYYFGRLDAGLKSHVLKNRYMTIIKNERLSDFFRDFPGIFFFDFKIWGYCLLFDAGACLKFARLLPVIMRAFKKRKMLRKKGIFN